MKKVDFVYVVLIFLIGYSFGKFIGGEKKETEIENRAKELNKECYTNQDIEYIIFKQSQL
jgi:uncharacterized membrane protein